MDAKRLLIGKASIRKRSIIYGLLFGVFVAGSVHWLRLETYLIGFLLWAVLTLSLMALLKDVELPFKKLLSGFMWFLLSYYVCAVWTYHWLSGFDKDFLDVAIFELRRSFSMLFIGVVICLFRLSKKNFMKYSLLVLLFFVAMMLFAYFNQNYIESLLKARQDVLALAYHYSAVA